MSKINMCENIVSIHAQYKMGIKIKNEADGKMLYITNLCLIQTIVYIFAFHLCKEDNYYYQDTVHTMGIVYNTGI